MSEKETNGNVTTEKITTTVNQPKTLGNQSAITVENGTELTVGEIKTVTVNQPQVAGCSSAVTVKNGTELTYFEDDDNMLQECLDVFASYITVIDQYLEEGAVELADYDGDNLGRKFISECAQGYLGRGGNFSFGKIMGVMGKSIWNSVYGITAGGITTVSHPLETIENAPAALGDIANVYTDGNWTQKLELTLEMAVMVYGSAKLKKMGKGGAKEAGKLAEAGEAAGAIDGVVGEAAEAIEGAAGKGKIRIESVGESGSKTNFDNEIPRSGTEWNEYLKGKYGEDNVGWNFNSIEDIIKDPTRLKGYTADELEKILGSKWTRDVYGSAGGGWKFLKGDMSIFYHPGHGRHGGSYYGISTATTGKIKVVNPDTYIPLPGDKATIIYEKR